MRRRMKVKVSRRESRNWIAVLDAHGVGFVVLDRRRDHRLLDAMSQQPGWRVDWTDGHSVFLARTGLTRQAGVTAA